MIGHSDPDISRDSAVAPEPTDRALAEAAAGQIVTGDDFLAGYNLGRLTERLAGPGPCGGALAADVIDLHDGLRTVRARLEALEARGGTRDDDDEDPEGDGRVWPPVDRGVLLRARASLAKLGNPICCVTRGDLAALVAALEPTAKEAP